MFLKEDCHIKRITKEETYAVRHPVLRTGKPIENCMFSGDTLASTIHLGLYFKESIIGVCSLMKSNLSVIDAKNQYQLRGMAVLEKYQKNGLGSLLLSNVETILKDNDIHFVWSNAREIAINFYKRNGFKIIGSPFNIPKIGTHYTMCKYL